MDANVEMLNYIYQNSQMGEHAVSQLVKSSEHPKFHSHMETQLAEYQNINRKAKELLNRKGQEEKDISSLAKISSYMSIEMKTMMDNSPSHMAEVMMQGSTMGIIDITKQINRYEDSGIEDEILSLANKLLRTEEANVEHLKPFLT